MITTKPVASLAITREMPIADLVEQYPEAIETLLSFGVHCLGCGASPYESLEDGFRSHGMNEGEIDAAILKLNEAVAAAPPPTEEKAGSITVTDAAVQKIKHVFQQKGKNALRIAVHPGGCSGFKYGLTLEEKSNPNDVVITVDGVSIYIDKKSMGKMSGATIDYIDDLQTSRFKITNPNATSSCGCGNSFR